MNCLNFDISSTGCNNKIKFNWSMYIISIHFEFAVFIDQDCDVQISIIGFIATVPFVKNLEYGLILCTFLDVNWIFYLF